MAGVEVHAMRRALLALSLLPVIAAAPAVAEDGPEARPFGPVPVDGGGWDWSHYDDPGATFGVDIAAHDHATNCYGDFAVTADGVEPVVLVHGTFTAGEEQYGANWMPRLTEAGIPHCVVTYPDRGQIDQQVSAEYVARAVQIASEHAVAAGGTGAVDLMGHSQGASMPRWAIKHWESVQTVLDDVVFHAGPHHGTTVAGSADPDAPVTRRRNPGQWQFAADSRFVHHVNSGDETPGTISYTSIYALTDELVQPSTGPDATAVLDGATNIDVQALDVCPHRPVDHLTIGTVDRFVMELTLDAFAHDDASAGATTADVDRLFAAQPLACELPPYGTTDFQSDGFSPQDMQQATDAEPPTKAYAIGFVDFQDR